MYSVKLIGINKVNAYFKKVGKDIVPETNRLLRKFADRTKQHVRTELSQRSSFQGADHNTPVPLAELYKVVKYADSYALTPLGTSGTANAKDLARWVNQGTAPHIQPNNWRISSGGVIGMHPGTLSSRMRGFMIRAFDRFVTTDMDKMIDEHLKRVFEKK